MTVAPAASEVADSLFKSVNPPEPISTWAVLEATVPAAAEEALAWFVITVPLATPLLTLVKNHTCPLWGASDAGNTQVIVEPPRVPPGLMEPPPGTKVTLAGIVSVIVTAPVLT